MRKMVFVLVFSFCFMNGKFTYAYSIAGALGVDCGMFLSDPKVDKDILKSFYISSFLGYITGRNYENNSDKAEGVSGDSVYFAVKKYCRNNPLKRVNDAMIHIYENELK